MSTNFSDVAFDESGNSLAIYLVDHSNTTNPIEATEFQATESGIMVRSSGFVRFIPYANIAEIRQSEAV